MVEIMEHIGMSTMEQKNLRAKTIEAMGYMIEAVANEKQTFFDMVQKITQMLVKLLMSGLSTDDP